MLQLLAYLAIALSKLFHLDAFISPKLQTINIRTYKCTLRSNNYFVIKTLKAKCRAKPNPLQLTELKLASRLAGLNAT